MLTIPTWLRRALEYVKTRPTWQLVAAAAGVGLICGVVV